MNGRDKKEKCNSILENCLIVQVRTLFVSGLPMDAKPRELYLLFRAYDGYENSQLKVTSKNGKTTSVRCCCCLFQSLIPLQKDSTILFCCRLQPVGFVTFATRASAEGAKQDLQVNHHRTHNDTIAARERTRRAEIIVKSL